MTKSPEQLDELIRRVQNHGDVSLWQKDPVDAGNVNLVSIISRIPKANIPTSNLLRVRSKILDRISLPTEKEKVFGISYLSFLPRFVRITGGIVGGFTILLSLTLGTAVAALESIPGQPIYPVKKMVENVQLQLASSPEAKANLQIKFANTRVDEMETVLQKKKEGKASDEQVQKVVANTAKDVEQATKTLSEQNKDKPQVSLLTKIVNLSNKQTAVLQAAQVTVEGNVKLELEKALESSKTAKDLAIENIEKAGLIVEEQPLTLEAPKPENTVTAEGKITTVTSSTLSIGTAQFLLTKDTEYANINPVDLKVGAVVKIMGEIIDKKTYATKIEAISKPEVKPEPVSEPEQTTQVAPPSGPTVQP